MRCSKVTITECADVTFAQESLDGTRIIRVGRSFYKPDRETFDSLRCQSDVMRSFEIEDNPVPLVVMAAIVIACLVLYFSRQEYRLVDEGTLLATMLLAINIPIHECGHVLVLRHFYHGSTIKVGFKLMFVFPAFYVDTSDSYLLPRYKRLAVYIAGNTTNAVFVLLSVVLFPATGRYCYLIVSTLLANLLPIAKGDGYYALITLRGKYNRHKSRWGTFLEDFVRGAVMFAALSGVAALSRLLLG